jgi:hypothetical protein
VSGDGASRGRRPGGMLIERDVAEIERRLRQYRENAPKRIAEEMGVHPNTVCAINLGRHPIQARLALERRRNGREAMEHGEVRL